MPRPTKLNEKVIVAMETAISSGATMNMAEAHAGIGKNSSMLWLRRGADPESPRIYREFRERIMRARERAGLRWLAEIQRVGREKDDWRAYAWLLERNFPETFGQRNRVDIGQVDAGEDHGAFWRDIARQAVEQASDDDE